MKTTRFSMMVCLAMMISGCATMQHYGRVILIEGHEALDGYFGDSDTNAPPSTNEVSTVAPGSSVDTTGMTQATPLVPYLGADDGAVNAVLFKRWQDGGNDGCGGLPGDTRPLLMRPAGGTFGWKYIITEREANGPNIILDGDYMTVTSGWYKGQFFKFEGKSDKEWDNGQRPTDFEAVKSGVRTLRKHFVSFTAWNKQ